MSTHHDVYILLLCDLWQLRLIIVDSHTINSFSLAAYGVDNRDTHPTHLTPWEKIYLGWAEPVEIDSDGTYELYASENSTEVYIIQSPFPKYEYFLIENRQPIGFDQQMWNGGIVLWHIDDTKLRMRDRGFPGQPGTCGGFHSFCLPTRFC